MYGPGLLRLDGLGYGVLEKDMEQEALRARKREPTVRLVLAGLAIDSSLRVPDGRGVQLLMRAYALTVGCGSRMSMRSSRCWPA